MVPAIDYSLDSETVNVVLNLLAKQDYLFGKFDVLEEPYPIFL